MDSRDDEEHQQNDLQQFQQLLKRDDFEAAFLVVFVDAPKERV